MIELHVPGVRAQVTPEYGGRLHQLFVPAGDREESLLVTPDDPAAYRDRPTRGGSFPMVPWPNRIREGRFRWDGRDFDLAHPGRPHAIHGLGLTREWELIYLVESALILQLRLGPADGWPWDCTVLQRYTLSLDSIRMELQIHAEATEFPVGAGWHPWFRRDVGGATGVRVTVPAAERYVLDQQIPIGTAVEPSGDANLRSGALLGDRRLDDCYRDLPGPAVIDWGALRLSMSVECPEPHLMVYTPPEAICLEPQSCAPDAFNLAERGVRGVGMAVARPGNPFRVASTWSWERPG